MAHFRGKSAGSADASRAVTSGRELAPLGLRHDGRDARGRFTRDNTGHLVHGATSQRRRAELAPVLRQERAGILRDKGFSEDDVPRVLSHIVDRFTEASAIAECYFQFIIRAGGPITTKGRQRRAVDGYLRACDRVAKLAAMLGLRREARELDTDSPAEWLARSSQTPADDTQTDPDTRAPDTDPETGR